MNSVPAHEQVWVKINAPVDRAIGGLISALSAFPKLQTIESCQGNGKEAAWVCFVYGIDAGEAWRELADFVLGYLGPRLAREVGDLASVRIQVTSFGRARGELWVDRVFRTKFLEKTDLTNQKAIYLLKKIEQQERANQRGGAGRELAPHRALTLEHILPKNPGEEWKGVLEQDPKILDECGLSLGNMCLLTETRNRDAARAGFEKKKALYADSDLRTTQQVAIANSWDRASILRRQDWLAARAVNVWRFQ